MDFPQKSTQTYTAPRIECVEIEVELGFAASNSKLNANVLPSFKADQNVGNDWFQQGEQEY